MAKTITLTVTDNISLSKTSSTSDYDSSSYQDKNTLNYSISYGESGTRKITDLATSSGIISSGTTTLINLRNFTEDIAGTTINYAFTGITFLNIRNISSSGYQGFTITATGSSGCTPILNGTTGNILLNSYSNWTQTHYLPISIASGTPHLQLNDTGSGSSYWLALGGFAVATGINGKLC